VTVSLLNSELRNDKTWVIIIRSGARTETGYDLNDRVSILDMDKRLYFTASILALGPTQSPIQGVTRGCFSGGKAARA
jgi:hypothetical protein